MLNLNNKTPPAACPAWCALADEVTDFYNKVDTTVNAILDSNFDAKGPCVDASMVQRNVTPLPCHLMPINSKMSETVKISSDHGATAPNEHIFAHAVARARQLASSAPSCLLSTLTDAQMLIMSIPVLLLVYVPLVLIVAGVFLVIFDAAKAVVALGILIAGLAPHSPSSHVMIIRFFSFIDRMVLRFMHYLLVLLNSRTFKVLLGPVLLLLPFLSSNLSKLRVEKHPRSLSWSISSLV